MKKPPLNFLSLLVLCFGLHFASAQGTAFTYQGRLINSIGDPANGSYDLTFTLFATNTAGAAISGPLTNSAIGVTNGLFTVTMDFGPGVFTGESYWLEIGLRTNGGALFSTLAPRQAITPSPYAVFATSASNLSGTLPLGQLPGAVVTNNNSAAVNLIGVFTGNGGGLSNVNAGSLNGLNATNFWKTAGNAGTTPTLSYLGTSDNQPLELHVNGGRALRVEPTASVPNLIGGYSGNLVDQGAQAVVIAGGGGFGAVNHVSSTQATIGGGTANMIQGNAANSTISGGGFNEIDTGSSGAFIGGGQRNWIQLNAGSSSYSVIGGGWFNTIQSNSAYSVLAGGESNSVQTGASYSVLAGGLFNSIALYSTASVVGGGVENFIGPDNDESTIGGGVSNNIAIYATQSVVAGGYSNSIQYEAYLSFIGGGSANIIGTNSFGSTIAGGIANYIQPNSVTSTLGGGYQNQIVGGNYSFIGGGYQNFSTGQNSSIAGGIDNTDFSDQGFIGGGLENLLKGENYSAIAGGNGNLIASGGSFIGAGTGNLISGNSFCSVIDGGTNNAISDGGTDSTIGGGNNNEIKANAYYSTIGGGVNNVIGGAGSTVPGGNGNYATGVNSFAAGTFAHATNDGSFVLTDQQYVNFYSIAPNEFSARFNGGYRFITGGSVLFATGSIAANQTVGWEPGSGSWTFSSDRNLKDRFEEVNPESVLDKVAQLPVSEWSYKGYGQRHIGAMAQDFHALFPLNDNDKGLNDVDLHGVELAAIKGLNQKLEEKEARIQELEHRLDRMERRLEQSDKP